MFAFDQLTFTVIHITGIDRLFCHMIQRGFIKKSSKFAKFFVAVLDDGTVRAVQQDVIIDIFYDFGFLGINLEFVIAEIIDAVHSHTTAK